MQTQVKYKTLTNLNWSLNQFIKLITYKKRTFIFENSIFV